MEKIIYDERALRVFKANFERVKANLMHIHECDLGSVDFRSELIVQLYKACDYRCLYRFMPLHGIGVMEQGRLIGKCSDYIVRDFIGYILNGEHFKCLRRCLDWLYCDGDVEYYPFDYEGDADIWLEIHNLKNQQVYDMGWTAVLEWVKDKYGLDVLRHYIWDTYVRKDVSAVAKKELEDNIEFCREQIRRWFDDPKVQKDFLLSGLSIGSWLKHKKNEWLKC